MSLTQLDRKFETFFSHSVISLATIIAVSIIIRFYFFPWDVPLTLDSQVYFWYASDTSILGRLPEGYSFANNGWPVFLAPFFAMFKFENMIPYMELQRVIAVLISTATVIPVYFLCKKFVSNPTAVFGAAIFAFAPRLIQNSLLGLNDSLYILLGTTSLVLFLKSDIKYRYASFALIGFASLVRSEGLFLLFSLSIMYFAQKWKNPQELAKYSILLGIFIITILPMSILRIDTTGTDALASRIINEASTASITSSNNGFLTYAVNTAITFFGFLGRIMIPIFAFFVPVGIVLIFRNRNFDKNTVIVTLFAMLVPVLYAYSISALDTKYFYFLYPIFCVLSVLAISWYGKKMKFPHILLTLAIVGIITASILFLVVKTPDRERELGFYQVAEFIVKNANGVNDYYPESRYISAAQQNEVWPSYFSSVEPSTNIIPVGNHSRLSNYILDSKDKGLTHIVADNKEGRAEFLKDVFYHEEKYPYLTKIFDSKKIGLKYDVKIFKINFSVLESDTEEN